MPRKWSPLSIFILTLAGLGLVYQLIYYPGRLLIPVVVLGVIFMAYVLQRRGPHVKHRTKSASRREQPQSKPKSRKTVPFRVIEGGKDDDNLPKYH
ncbi:hypothetical protein [Paenibacillus spongiae]|uniref:Uncharacterized protein n=1 Tax=Paenibacillus spongiae TaxID=2909671 RepID=A0ABY5SE76_9BACL|nr:hypothetical protein [Paenibacillus spongiae]UVI32271.1 hypothetical protein L1F29_10830 [Paenibacillus spongiae]